MSYLSPTLAEQAREEVESDVADCHAKIRILCHWIECLRMKLFAETHGIDPLEDDRVADAEWIALGEAVRDVLPTKAPAPEQEAAMLRIIARRIGQPVPTVEWWKPETAPGGDLPGQPVGGAR